MTPSDIAGKTILLNFFAVFTTSITASTALYDILSYHLKDTEKPSPEMNTDKLSTKDTDTLSSKDEQARSTEAPDPTPLLTTLRNEAIANSPSNPRALSKLDSTLRETLRLHPAGSRGNQREVVAPNGVTTPDGLFLPQGTHVCAYVAPMQNDVSFPGHAGHEDVNQYRPLRHCPALEGGELAEGDKQPLAVQISPSYLSFSLGKHACPGRFWAAQTIKVMIAELLVRYDFEVLEKEPKYLEVGEARRKFRCSRCRVPRADLCLCLVPPQDKKHTVKVRRRRDVDCSRYEDVLGEKGRAVPEGNGVI